MIKLPEKGLTLLWIGFLALIAVVIIQNSLIIINTHSGAPSGNPTAEVTICIEQKPYWLNPIDCSTAFATIPYSCNVSAQHPTRQVDSYDIAIEAGNTSNNALFNVSNEGILSFTANVSQAGNYTLNITAVENYESCQSINTTVFNLTISVSNLAPILVQNIPNSTWDQDIILIPYDLDNYFEDPNGDELSYRAAGNTQIKIDINSQGQVTLTPATGYCGTEIVNFIATDPGNLSATSNDVTLTVNCEEEDEQDSGSSGGGGGSGSGGSSEDQDFICREEKFCYDWSECYYTRAVIEDEEDSRLLTIEGSAGKQTFLIEGDIPEDKQIFYTGYQWRECIDTNQCEVYDRQYVTYCEYEPSCSDNIQNQNEIDVDCGGVCGPCHTCSDGIQNGKEKDVDCGGPDCKECHTCTDGVINGNELGVDCGGPDCPSCTTCFDGIRNGLEEGVDCGGPNCRECAQEQEPSVAQVASRGLLAALLVSFAALLLLLFGGRKVASMLSAVLLKYKKKNRIILIDAETRRKLIGELEAISTTGTIREILKEQEMLAHTVREYLNVAVGVEIEVQAEELQKHMSNERLHPQLIQLLNDYFIEIETMQFTGAKLEPEILEILRHEAEQIITQTSVLATSDLALLDQNELPATAKELPFAELLDAGHKLIMSNRLSLASAVYNHLHERFATLDRNEQERFYQGLRRLYLAINLAETKQQSLLYRRK